MRQHRFQLFSGKCIQQSDANNKILSYRQEHTPKTGIVKHGSIYISRPVYLFGFSGFYLLNDIIDHVE
ncbi:MAG TPA: hypothetical protein PKZ51_14835 [Saprospiraceae bacterium]|nr:hypothetical protein [Saprospiraceae bacterium]